MEVMEQELKAKADSEIQIIETGCHGFCEMGPIMIIYPEGTFYCRVQPEDIAEIVEVHLIKAVL